MASGIPSDLVGAVPDEPTVRRLLDDSVRRTQFLRKLLKLSRLKQAASSAVSTHTPAKAVARVR